jgi:hypothetical protein
MVKNLEGLRLESDMTIDEREVRISQGKRQMIRDFIKSVDDSGMILEKLKPVK